MEAGNRVDYYGILSELETLRMDHSMVTVSNIKMYLPGYQSIYIYMCVYQYVYIPKNSNIITQLWSCGME